MKVKLKVNSLTKHPKNPRLIKDAKFRELITSVLCSPHFLDPRGVVVNMNNQVIAGWQRTQVLCLIATFSLEEIGKRLGATEDLAVGRRIGWLMDYWERFLKEKAIEVTQVDWTEEEQEEFMIKDNAHSGEWNQDMLANLFDDKDLNNWGINTYGSTDEPKQSTTQYIKVTFNDNSFEAVKNEIESLQSKYDIMIKAKE